MDYSSTYASTAEAADPHCLRVGEAAALLAGHPWRRLAIVGDSVAEGLGDPVEGYVRLGWADRVAAELSGQQPELSYVNLGARNLRAAQVRARQLADALAFKPDLAVVACGGYDALRPGFDPDAVDMEIAAIVTAFRGAGADVITIGLLVMSDYPALPQWLRAGVVKRLRLLGQHANSLAVEFNTIHADMSAHPASATPALLLSRDGLHANGRCQAICAAAAVRSLGAHLGNTFTGVAPG